MSDRDDKDPPRAGGNVIPFARPRKGAQRRPAERRPPPVYATQAHAEQEAALEAYNASLAALDKLDIESEMARVEQAIAEGRPGAYEARAGVLNARALRSYARGEHAAAIAAWGEIIAEYPAFVDARVTRATFHRHEGRIREAIDDLDRAAELDPQNATLYQNRGACYESLGDLDRAMANFRRAAQLDPTSAPAHASMGRRLSTAQDFAGAIRAYTRAIKCAPNDANLYSNRASCHARAGDAAAALADYDRSLAIFPPQIDIWIARGACRHELELYDLAVDDYTRAIAARPGDAHILRRRGEALLDADRVEPAVADLRRAAELAPEGAGGHWLLGVALERAGDDAGALAAYDRAVEGDPTCPTFVLSRAGVHARAGRADALREDLGRVLALCPADVELLMTHAHLSVVEDDLDRALSDLDRAIELAPDNARAWHMRAEVRRDQHDMDGAFEDESRAAALDPTNPEYRAWLGRYRYATDPTPEGREAALGHLDAAIEMAPDRSTAWIQRAALHAQDERWAEAIPDYDRAIERDPGKFWYHFHRGVARRRAHEKEDTASLRAALADFDRALELTPEGEGNPSTVYVWQGDTLEDLGELDTALTAFEHAVEHDPGHWEAIEGRGRVRMALGDETGAAEDFKLAEAVRAREEEDDEDGDDEGEGEEDEGLPWEP
jgi:tetratricopeptide (TPR) repeat protein